MTLPWVQLTTGELKQCIISAIGQAISRSAPQLPLSAFYGNSPLYDEQGWQKCQRLGKEFGMKANYRLAPMLIASAGLGAAAITGLKAQIKPPVYVVFDFSEMLDDKGFVKGVSTTDPVAAMAAAGGHYVIRSTKPVALDGPAPPARFVMISFDSEEKVRAWRDSAAVKELDANRMKTSKSRAFMVEGFAN
jgi:uncharacterized protein (DUF1330 family)